MKNDYDRYTDMAGIILTGIGFCLCTLGAVVMLIGITSALLH